MQLARCSLLGSVRAAVDIQAAHPTDSLAAIVIEMNRVFAFWDEAFVQNIQHLQERHIGRYVIHIICFEGAFGAAVFYDR